MDHGRLGRHFRQSILGRFGLSVLIVPMHPHHMTAGLVLEGSQPGLSVCAVLKVGIPVEAIKNRDNSVREGRRTAKLSVLFTRASQHISIHIDHAVFNHQSGQAARRYIGERHD